MLQKDRVAASTAAIEKLFANPDAETAELIKQAWEDYDSEYIFVLIIFFFILKYVHLTFVLRAILEYIFMGTLLLQIYQQDTNSMT